MKRVNRDIQFPAGWPALTAVFVVGAATTWWVMAADAALAERLTALAPEAAHGAWPQILEGFQNFSQLLSLVTAGVLVGCLDSRRLRLVLALLVAQALANVGYQVVKRCVERQRPCVTLSPDTPSGETSAGDAAAESWVAVGFADRDWSQRSFPSGHSAAAFALAGVLAAGYRRVAWWFWLLAAGCALSRVITGVHWPSDCVAGAVLGWFAAQAALAVTRGAGERDVGNR